MLNVDDAVQTVKKSGIGEEAGPGGPASGLEMI
jgi:hypothetical protein